MFLREYSIEPEALAQHPLPRIITSSFGVESGRYLATVQSHNKWRQRVAHAISNLRSQGQGNSRQTEYLVDWLMRQKNTSEQNIYVERPESSYDGQLSWLENIMLSHAITPYDAIITHAGESGTYRLDEVDNEQDWWSICLSENIQKTPSDYARVLERTLKRSQNIIIMDPFFKIDKKSLAVITAMFNKMDPKLKPQIEIICLKGNSSRDDVSTTEQLIDRCNKDLRNIIPQGAVLTFRRVDAVLEEKYHDRYLLTDKLNLIVGYGFDGSEKDKRTTTVARIGLTTAVKLRNWIKDASIFRTDFIWSSEDNNVIISDVNKNQKKPENRTRRAAPDHR